jgi:hypothetical protein
VLISFFAQRYRLGDARSSPSRPRVERSPLGYHNARSPGQVCP